MISHRLLYVEKIGITYYNRCFMEKAGVQEETELAGVVDWECIYG